MTLLARREIDVAENASTPPPVLVDALFGVIGNRALVTIAHLRSHQEQYTLDDSYGHRLLTVEDDRVTIIDDGCVKGSLRVVEVELTDETRGREALDRAITRLRDAGTGDPDPTSKLVHVLGDRARRARPPALGDDATVDVVVRAAEGIAPLAAGRLLSAFASSDDQPPAKWQTCGSGPGAPPVRLSSNAVRHAPRSSA